MYQVLYHGHNIHIELNWMDASKGKGCRFGKVGVDPRGTRAKRTVGAGAHLHAPPLVVRQMRVGQVRALNKSTPFAEVVGADLSDFLADPAAGRKEMRRLLSTHGLVIFRGVTLTPAEELKVNELADYHVLRNESKGLNFGWSDEAALQEAGIATIPAVPEVVCQGNACLEGYHGIHTMQLCVPTMTAPSGSVPCLASRLLSCTLAESFACVRRRQSLTFGNEGFHSDGVHNLQDQLPVLTSMYCVRAPELGGETHFACGRLAFNRLPAALQHLARRLTVHYVYDEAAGLAIMRDGIVRDGRGPGNGSGGATTRTAHPLVRRHPQTAEESIYLSCANIDFMEAVAQGSEPSVHLDTEASYQLVERLLGEVTSAPHEYAHVWRPADFAIWDNRITLHAPCSADGIRGERLHHRVRLGGSAAANADLAEHALRRELTIAHTLSHHHGFDELVWNHISARLPSTSSHAADAADVAPSFLVTPGDVGFEEVTPATLVKSSPDNVNVTADVIHSAIYAARPDVHAIVHHHTPAVVAVACMQGGLRFLTQVRARWYHRRLLGARTPRAPTRKQPAALAISLPPPSRPPPPRFAPLPLRRPP